MIDSLFLLHICTIVTFKKCKIIKTQILIINIFARKSFFILILYHVRDKLKNLYCEIRVNNSSKIFRLIRIDGIKIRSEKKLHKNNYI